MRRVLAVVVCLLPSIAVAQPLQPVQILHTFTTSPSWPNGGLLQVADGSFYGVTRDAIYRIAPGGQVSVACRFAGGTSAIGTLALGPDGALYGTTQDGDGNTSFLDAGSHQNVVKGSGSVFRFDPSTGEVRTVHTFDGSGAPLGGLALAGGSMYGLTPNRLFKVDSATGATTTEFAFGASGGGPQIGSPTGPLTMGADGRLYGSSSRSLYRFDPALPGTVTELHTFTNPSGPGGRLLLGPDHRLYGSALGNAGGGDGGVYRFDPATNVFEVLHPFPEGAVIGPGPVVMGSDGTLYGTTSITNQPGPIPPKSGPSAPVMLFRLRPTAGGYTYEELRAFDVATFGVSHRAELALGSDGLVYGYSQYGGPSGNGTVYRFDPAEGGPPSDPFAFTLVHTFVPETTWGPSAPVPGSDGLLYGTTSRGGSARRGAIYALNPATGAVTIPVSIPGTPATTSTGSNSSLMLAADNALYGTSAMTSATGFENTIVRFVPATGVATAIPAMDPDTGPTGVDSSMARVPSRGELYYMRNAQGGAMRYDPANGTLTPVGSVPIPSGYQAPRTTAPILATDGQLYVGVISGSVPSFPPGGIRHATARIVRIARPPDALGLVEVANLGEWIGATNVLAGLAVGADGALYVSTLPLRRTGSMLERVDPATGAHTAVCTFPFYGAPLISAVADGRLVGITYWGGTTKLLICTPSTGAVEMRALPQAVGRVAGPLVEIGGVLYGAAWGAPAQPGGALVRMVLDGTPPAIDTDADGLPSEWETRYGLDPLAATADDGSTGDPDGDGLTNAQELAAGTHPRGFVRRYFAEGATGPFFRTRIDLANANPATTATILLSFLTDTGGRIVHDVVLGPLSHMSVDPSTLTGLAHATFATLIEADATIAVDRTMTWDASGYGSHIETAVTAPATTWYLAEGSTSGPFSLFYLLQNSHAVPVTATVRYLRPAGLSPIERAYTLQPNSRRTIVVDDEGADLASTDVSAVITADAPIVAERAMYFSRPEQPFAAGHESAGVTAPALEWFFAEGATGAFFDLFLLIANPNATAAAVEVEYLLEGGGSLIKTYTVPGNARTTIWVDDEQIPADSGIKPLAGAAVSMTVRSTNGVPIVAERTMWWPGPTVSPTFWSEAHNSPGATTSALRWLVAGGDFGGAASAQTYVLIANPGNAEGRARITELTDTGPNFSRDYTLPAKSRTNVSFVFDGSNEGGLGGASGRGGPFSILIESIGAVPVPIVVEHATYTSPGGVVWAAGGNALAAPIPSTDPYTVVGVR